MDLDVVVTTGGKDVRGVGFEFDQVLGGFGPDTFQVRECKPCQAGRSREGFRLGEHDQRHPPQHRGFFNLRDARVDIDLFEVRIVRKLGQWIV